MSPLARRRWANFKANRRGYVSLWIFLAIFTVTLFAELLANDRPIVLIHQDEWYFPVLIGYSEADLGGELPLPADFRDPYVLGLIGDAWALWPPIPFSYDSIDYAIGEPAPAPPSRRHWLGTDDVAKDTLARLIYGFRLSVVFGILLTLASSAIGIAVGALQGYFGGMTDLVGQRIVEVWQGLPILFLLIILASIVEPGFGWLLLLLVAFGWMALVGVVRAEFLRARNLDFVRAARALGVSDLVIMRRHVLPNAMVAALTFLPFLLNGSITTLTALDFLGFGLPPGAPSLGELLRQGQANLQAPWLGLSGFLTLAVMLTLLIFVGEAVRDAFDPRRALVRTGHD
ncbi:MAG: ABC transporter permease [Gammaproteobacteria bacterium]|nr:ABC transporter permease [Gammaproteobacteria bacterium]